MRSKHGDSQEEYSQRPGASLQVMKRASCCEQLSGEEGWYKVDLCCKLECEANEEN